MNQNKKNVLVLMSKPEQGRFAPLLEGMGLEISWAETLEEAQRHFTGGSQPGAVVIDEELPGADWREAAESLAHGDHDVPFLICTNSPGDKPTLVESRKIPISDTLVKPYSQKLVQSRLMHALSAETNKPKAGAGTPSHPAE